MDATKEVEERQEVTLFSPATEMMNAASPGVSSPDQAVIHGTAAGQEPWLGGRASRGGSQPGVGKAIPHSGRPALHTHTRPGAETETDTHTHINNLKFTVLSSTVKELSYL